MTEQLRKEALTVVEDMIKNGELIPGKDYMAYGGEYPITEPEAIEKADRKVLLKSGAHKILAKFNLSSAISVQSLESNYIEPLTFIAESIILDDKNLLKGFACGIGVSSTTDNIVINSSNSRGENANSAAKIAAKRADVDATIRALNLGPLFTQDITEYSKTSVESVGTSLIQYLCTIYDIESSEVFAAIEKQNKDLSKIQELAIIINKICQRGIKKKGG